VNSTAEFKAQRRPPDQMDHLHGAFVYSVLFHLLLMLAWELNRHYDLVSALRIVETLDPTRLVIKAEQKEREIEIPFQFVQVDPATTATDAPKNAAAYSDISSAATSDKSSETKSDQPKLDGKKRESMLVKDVARESAGAPPSPPPAPPESKAAQAPDKQTQSKTEPDPPKRAEPKPLPKPTEIEPLPTAVLMAKAIPIEKPPPEPKPQPLLPKPAPQEVMEPVRTIAETPPITLPPSRRRPTSLAEARARQSQTQLIVGESMRRDGGNTRIGRGALNVIGTSFGAYDKMIIDVIQRKWHMLMGTRPTSRGTVRLQFKHWSNGRVTDMETIRTSVDDFQTTICQMAIQNSAPFRPWPIDLRRLHEKDYREVTFSFTY
jgi:hypothetical protein